MSCCSIRWCGKNSKTSNSKTDGITFHRFPTDPDIKEQWIECVNRENWFPSNYSVVCSRHFTEDCFHKSKSRRRLLDTAIPTLNLCIVSNISLPETASPKPSTCSQKEFTPRATIRKATDSENPSEFHTPTEQRLWRRVLQLTNQAKRKNKIIKVLQDKARYYKRRVVSLEVILKELEEKKLVKVEDGDILNKVDQPAV